MVFEIGQYALTIQSAEQETPIEDKGKYVVVWKKGDDGIWMLHVDIWNTSLPAQ
jgi:ketosteroid isomerase-like protein